MGRQINLDDGSARVLSAKTIDNIYIVSTYLTIEFECEEKLDFTPSSDNYFTFNEIDWVPEKVVELPTNDGTWRYSLSCLTRPTYRIIDKPYTTMSGLAMQMGVKLVNGSQDFNVKNPIINNSVLWITREIRRQSMNDAMLKGDLKSGYFIYFNSEEMICTQWKTLMIATTTLPLLNLSPELVGSDSVLSTDDRLVRWNSTGWYGRRWEEGEFLDNMIGTKIKIITSTPMVFGALYTIKFSNSNEFDEPKPFLCMGVERNYMEGTGVSATLCNFNI